MKKTACQTYFTETSVFNLSNQFPNCPSAQESRAVKQIFASFTAQFYRIFSI